MKTLRFVAAMAATAMTCAACAGDPSATPATTTAANVLAAADVGVQRANQLGQVVCAGRTLVYATAQTAMGLAGASPAAWADEAKAEGALEALCTNLPANLADVVPKLLAAEAAVKARITAPTAPPSS